MKHHRLIGVRRDAGGLTIMESVAGPGNFAVSLYCKAISPEQCEVAASVLLEVAAALREVKS